MKFLWCDTETTGLKTENAAPFQIAFIFVSNIEGVKTETERVFMLNPFDIPGIEYSTDAAKVHGYSKEEIEKFFPSKQIVPKIAEFLESMKMFTKNEKMFFCGYNSNTFDWDHLCSLFNHYGLKFSEYFENQKLDVFEQVKRAGAMKILPYLENRKLVTIAKFLGINHEKAHDALSDIQTTREVAKSLAQMGVPLQ